LSEVRPLANFQLSERLFEYMKFELENAEVAGSGNVPERYS
jgi:hypothetical protein